jgi:hypothetical protein
MVTVVILSLKGHSPLTENKHRIMAILITKHTRKNVLSNNAQNPLTTNEYQASNQVTNQHFLLHS